jgi:hypothetical protein
VANIEEFAEQIRMLMRAIDGLSADDREALFKLINTDDIREKTRIQPEAVIAHTYCRLLAEHGGEEYEIYDDIAEFIDHYCISEEGKNWDAAILMERSKNEGPMQSVTVGTVPNVEGQEQAEQTQKRSFTDRLRGR